MNTDAAAQRDVAGKFGREWCVEHATTHCNCPDRVERPAPPDGLSRPAPITEAQLAEWERRARSIPQTLNFVAMSPEELLDLIAELRAARTEAQHAWLKFDQANHDLMDALAADPQEAEPHA